MYWARSAARSGGSKADSFRVKSFWSPGVPKAGPNSSDTSKALFARDIWEFESSQPSHAVGSLRANVPARCFRANNQLGAAIWIVIQGSGSDVSDAQGFPRLRRFTPWLRASDRKNSIPLRRQETAALRDVNSPYVGLVSGSPRRGNPRSLRHFDGRSARFRTIQI
jgi:hypothetical protein